MSTITFEFQDNESENGVETLVVPIGSHFITDWQRATEQLKTQREASFTLPKTAVKAFNEWDGQSTAIALTADVHIELEKMANGSITLSARVHQWGAHQESAPINSMGLGIDLYQPSARPQRDAAPVNAPNTPHEAAQKPKVAILFQVMLDDSHYGGVYPESVVVFTRAELQKLLEAPDRLMILQLQALSNDRDIYFLKRTATDSEGRPLRPSFLEPDIEFIVEPTIGLEAHAPEELISHDGVRDLSVLLHPKTNSDGTLASAHIGVHGEFSENRDGFVSLSSDEVTAPDVLKHLQVLDAVRPAPKPRTLDVLFKLKPVNEQEEEDHFCLSHVALVPVDTRQLADARDFLHQMSLSPGSHVLWEETPVALSIHAITPTENDSLELLTSSASLRGQGWLKTHPREKYLALKIISPENIEMVSPLVSFDELQSRIETAINAGESYAVVGDLAQERIDQLLAYRDSQDTPSSDAPRG